MKHKKIVITGGTGFLGQAIAKYFGKDNHIVILSRQHANGHNNNYSNELIKSSDGYNISYWRWDGRNIEKHWAQEVDGADIVINLAGKSVNCRYTDKNKQEIIDSRIDATRLIGNAIRACVSPPKLWINASSATAYRHTLDHPQDEFTGEISDFKNDNMPYSFFDRLRRRLKKMRAAARYGRDSEQYKNLDKDFSVQVIKLWEGTFFEQRTPFTRKVAIRSAITLGEGGVVVPYFNLLKFALGGYQGNGRQLYSWVHIDDLCGVIEWCYEQKEVEGIYNVSSPGPVSNHTFMKTLRNITGHKIGLPAWTWMLEFGTFLIGSETELVLKSRWVMPARLLKEGFRFKYEKLEDALKEIVDKTPRKHYHLF